MLMNKTLHQKLKYLIDNPELSMYGVYLPTFTIRKKKTNVGEYIPYIKSANVFLIVYRICISQLTKKDGFLDPLFHRALQRVAFGPALQPSKGKVADRWHDPQLHL